MCGVHRVTVQRWMSQGAVEIAEAAEGGDDDAELGPRAEFALAFETARAGYLLELSEAWKTAISKRDANTAKVVATMLASVSPDEFSERRVVRTVDQKTTLAGEIGVTRFTEMSVEALDAERERIQARRAAAKAQPDDDWRDAAVKRPGPPGEDIDPAPRPGEKTPASADPGSGSQTRKLNLGALPGHDRGSTTNISPTRARTLNASVEDDKADVVAVALPPDVRCEGGGARPRAEQFTLDI